ncbi:MAG: ZIP family metal transporter [Eggerthellaceae bacterium]|nr:ZIP family metal transporter [Eggerthellaceae bacterium]
MVIALAVALIVPFAGNTIGAAFVFFMRRGMSEGFQKALLGFAAGVMIAASVWSLLIPSIEASEAGPLPAWIPAAGGFLGGMLLLLLIDHFTPHLHVGSDEPEGVSAPIKKPTMMIFALAIHNLPEGMAVGAVLAGFLSSDPGITLSAVVALSIGIAIQNIPEGAVVSMPLTSNGMSRAKAFGAGTACGAVEPLGALIMLAVTEIASPALPYVLAFAAGAMMYVVTEELIPETQSGKHTNIGTIGVAVGFVLMMVLDVALG